MVSTLVLSHAATRSLSSSILKLEPRFPFVEEAFSTGGGGGGGESETDTRVFWDVPIIMTRHELGTWTRIVTPTHNHNDNNRSPRRWERERDSGKSSSRDT